MAQAARHEYGDWIRHTASGKVAVICTADLKNYLAKVKYVDGSIEQMTIFDYDLITEYEFLKVVDPARCGDDLMQRVEGSYLINHFPGEDWFTGGRMKTVTKVPKEDLFG